MLLSFSVADVQAKNDAALHFLMRHVMSASNLPLAIEEILARPHVRLLERIEVSPIEEIEEANADLIADGFELSSLSLEGPLARLF